MILLILFVTLECIFQEAQRVLAWLRCRDEEDAAIKQELERIRIEQKTDAESSKFALKAVRK